jgi:heme-degrading monooxygenase HmoA
MPETSGAKGLLAPELLRSTDNPDEGMSVSLWENLEDMLAFERDPLRQDLARGLEEFYPPLAYPRGDYWVKRLEIISPTPLEQFRQGYLRVVGGRLRLGGWQEYERFHAESVGSTTGSTNGLRQRQLLRGTDDPDEAVTLSIWDTLEDMRSYETGAVRQEMAKQVEHLYTGQYWVKHFQMGVPGS